MSMKQLSDAQLESIGKKLSLSLSVWGEIWSEAMKGLRINSPEYQSICRTGKHIQKTYAKMQFLAEERGWTQEKINEIFKVNAGYSFS